MSPATLPAPVAASPTSENATARADVFPRVETAVALVVGLLAGWLHYGFFRQVGALWRDEVNSVRLATLPTLGETWRWLPFDSFPVGFHVLLRAFGAVFPTGSDTALRALGLGIGLAVVGALCLNARAFGFRWPLLSLALLGANPLFVRYGDSLRAYGLGILLCLWTLGAVWRFVERPRPGRWLLAAVLALASVHVVFYNAVLLFAFCAAGAAVAAGERRWRPAAAVLAIGLPAALSLGVYAAMVREQHDWSFLVGFPVTLGWLWTRVCEVTGSPARFGVWLWASLFLAAAGTASLAWTKAVRTWDAAEVRRLRFAGVALVLMVVCYAGFLRVLNYRTQPWYYISLLAPLAFCVDLVFAAGLGRAGRWRWLRPAVAALFAASAGLDAQGELSARQTNVDLVAERIDALATADDLVVFDRWECAIPYERYQRGTVPMVTVPPLEDHRFHRYDLVKAQMMTPDAMAPVLARMEATLRAGHRVWLAGPLVAPPDDRPATAPPPARLVNGRFLGTGDYYTPWQAQAGALLRDHAVHLTPIRVTGGQPILTYEKIPLTEFDGWH